MKRRRRWLVGIGLALASAPASAFVLEQVDVGGKLRPLRWPAAQIPIPFVLSDRSLSLLPNLAANSLPRAAVEAALRSWSVAPVLLYLDGTVPTTDAGLDGVNLITFANTARNRDAVGNWTAYTPYWHVRDSSRTRIVEADVVLNPQSSFATDGTAAAYDIRSLVTRELGHALGLDHTLVLAATMSAHTAPGLTFARTLEEDDLAGLRALYGGGAPETGAITGRVLTTAEVNVFGAHVVATDASGVTRVSAVSDPDGSFTIPSLLPGSYQIYAEPMDGPTLPDYLYALIYRDTRRPVLRDFRTAFAGGNATPATITVTAGTTTAIDPLRVDAQKATLSPFFLGWSPDGNSFQSLFDGVPVQIAPGSTRYLVVGGGGLSDVVPAGFSASGSDLVVDTSHFERGTTSSSRSFVIFRLTARAGAPRGPRNLYLAGSTERATLTGAIEIEERG